MDKVSGRLTVFFEEPFWIGVFERISEGKLSVCKVTFGAEPKDYEVYDFLFFFPILFSKISHYLYAILHFLPLSSSFSFLVLILSVIF